MTDAIELRGRRKSELREAFRAIERDPERGPGTVVAFANWDDTRPYVDATLRGLLETGSITEPVKDERGRAVVTILGEGEDPGSSEPAQVTLQPAQIDQNRPEPPPQSGPGSGVEHWREYATETTQTAPNFWADKSRTEIIEALESQGVPV